MTPEQIATHVGELVLRSLTPPPGSPTASSAGELLESIAPGQGRTVGELLMLAFAEGAAFAATAKGEQRLQA